MSNWSQLFSSKWQSRDGIRTFLCFLVPGLIATLAYLPSLRNFLTGTDAITLIESSRMDSFGDFVEILSRPLMDGTAFINIALFYRPLASMSYALDYVLWGLNPFGYHLTNLILHVLVTLSVAYLMRSLSKDNWVGFLAATIFTMHPILVESVPAVDRRHDLIAGLFVTISLALYLRNYRSECHRRLWQILSLAAYGFALVGKEIAIILPGLIFAHAALFQESERFRTRLARALKVTVPYVVFTLMYVVWRVYILDGIGGYLDSDSVAIYRWDYVVDVIRCYFQDILDPTDFWGCFVVGDYCVALVLLPLTSICLLAHLMFKGDEAPESYITPCKPVIVFLLVWIVLPLILLAVTKTFSHRSMYAAAIPFSALLAIAIRASVKILQPIWRGARRWSGLKAGHVAAALLLVLSIGNVVCLAPYSPLFCRYQHWNDSAKISAIFLEKLAKLVGKLPKNGVIHICDLPEGISSYNDKHPRAKEVTYIRDYSIKSWLDLRFPGNTFKVLVHRRSWPRTFTGYLDLKTQRSSFNSVWVFVSVQARPPARLGMNPSLKWRVAGRHYF